MFATAMTLLAGNSGVGNAIATQQLYDRANYSQSLESEADQLGAQYLYKAQYDSEGLIGGLGSIFNYTKLVSGTNTGIQYRALQSHPRNDKRLRAAIREIGELPPGEAFGGRSEYRNAIEGLVYGQNLKPNAPAGYVRYNNEALGITFLHPKDWNRTIKGAKIIIKDPEETLQFKIEIEKTAVKAQASIDAIKAKYPDELKNVEKIDPKSEKDLGAIAVRKNQRVGLIKVARNTFHFQGISRDNHLSKDKDQVFLGMIASFRRMHQNDKNITELKRIYFEQLKPGETFSSIGNDKNDENVAEEAVLRVINGYYPKGEAEPGTWIKKLRQVKVDQDDRNAKSADGK